MKKAIMSNCKDPENRSDKNCLCGNHSTKSKNSKRNKLKRTVVRIMDDTYIEKGEIPDVYIGVCPKDSMVGKVTTDSNKWSVFE